MPRPALLTQTSTWPKRASEAASAPSTSSRRVTSATSGSVSGPQRAATSRSSFSRRASNATRAPLPETSSASAAPIPPLAPVMTMTLPFMWLPTLRAVRILPGRSGGSSVPVLPEVPGPGILGNSRATYALNGD